jgi:hypothetical protein
MALLAVDLTGPTASSLRRPLALGSASGRTAGSMMVRAWLLQRPGANMGSDVVAEQGSVAGDGAGAQADADVILGRLLRRAWTHYRWEGRPRRRP